MAELLEATKKMMTYFTRSLKHTPSHSNNTDHHQNNASTHHTDNHRCNPHYYKDQVNKITSDTCTSQHLTTESDTIPDNANTDSSDNTLDSASDSE